MGCRFRGITRRCLLSNGLGVDTNGRACIGTDSITFTLLSLLQHLLLLRSSTSSDAGPSNTDNLTNVTTPTLTGTVTPSTGTVYLYAEKDGGSPSIVASVQRLVMVVIQSHLHQLLPQETIYSM